MSNKGEKKSEENLFYDSSYDASYKINSLPLVSILYHTIHTFQ